MLRGRGSPCNQCFRKYYAYVTAAGTSFSGLISNFPRYILASEFPQGPHGAAWH